MRQPIERGGENRSQGYCRGAICETDLLIGLYGSDMTGLSFNLRR